MKRDRQRLTALVASVADGTPLDWDALSTNADEPSQRLISHLRIVAQVGDVHRSFADEPVTTTAPPWAPAMEHSTLAPGPLELGRWGHLEIIEKIGDGGFGEVYRARDPWLDCDVALKLVKPDAAGSFSPQRIINEARTLARVRHTNIVTIHGADSHDGRAGLWMELVRGRTLSQMLSAQGPFGPNEAAVVGQDVCRALAAVHAAGIVHQDVKAQNVMRESGGRFVLMDFGAGSTPVYLAPEVLQGGRTSVASDIYAVGVLLFYLVTRRYPVNGASVHELKEAHRQGVRLRLADVRADLPDTFVAVVERALAPRPENRFTSASEMREALGGGASVQSDGRRISSRAWRLHPAVVAATVLLLLASVMVAGVIRRVAEPQPTAGGRTVAVLPFRAISDDPDTVFLSDGLSEDLTAQLASLASVQVISGASTRRYRDSTRALADVGRELGVDTIISGSVRLIDGTIRVAVEVTDARKSHQLWARLFDSPRSEITRMQSDVVQQVSMAVKGHLTPEDTSRLSRHVTEPRAFELYLQGRYYWNTRTQDGLRRSIDCFTDAIAIDPSSALPYAGLADAYMLSAFYYHEPPAVAHAHAEAAALEALRLDPNLAQVHAALGSLRLTQFRWAEAEVSLKRAIDLNPSYASAHQWYGLWLAQHRRFAEAMTEMRAAREADPFSHVIRSAFAYVYYAAREYDNAAREYREVLDVDPAFFPSLTGLIETLAARGFYDEAIAMLAEAERRTGRGSDLSVAAAYVYAQAGRSDEARRYLQHAEAHLETSNGSRADVASVYGVLGDATGAFDWLARAVDNRDTQLGYLGVDPRFDSLRADPRFDALMTAVGLTTR